MCEVCNITEESTLHVFRECPMAAEIWRRLLPSHAQTEFFSADLEKWLASNLMFPSRVGGDGWASIFGVVVWKLWRWRNENLFTGKNRNVEGGLHEINCYILGLTRVNDGALTSDDHSPVIGVLSVTRHRQTRRCRMMKMWSSTLPNPRAGHTRARGRNGPGRLSGLCETGSRRPRTSKSRNASMCNKRQLADEARKAGTRHEELRRERIAWPDADGWHRVHDRGFRRSTGNARRIVRTR
ncbi:Polynucleotidyl transferase- ribonuclease H-like superfamily protein [Striga hermonthica]|uniref:Polynucleotidyl transferase- ribonuclease H-like superfamily protein n=1 Tax=Striga hermonthica TaxID=68872 RepID=A0A9N7MGJ6_STRHE|nr:Polynucleotidyl transferase- ribonuclease H-like superfamily protein [Striga hermonthica]